VAEHSKQGWPGSLGRHDSGRFITPQRRNPGACRSNTHTQNTDQSRQNSNRKVPQTEYVLHGPGARTHQPGNHLTIQPDQPEERRPASSHFMRVFSAATVPQGALGRQCWYRPPVGEPHFGIDRSDDCVIFRPV
jgi:hypothetical protein